MYGPRASGDVEIKSTGDLVRAYRSLRRLTALDDAEVVEYAARSLMLVTALSPLDRAYDRAITRESRNVRF
jgi:hypothetical protein